jgi:glycosyltransferase involved in cell wall biosynthesis
MSLSVPISVVILTKNEELDLPDCLASVAWSDDIHVFDSFSTDRTLEIAAQHGAKVTQRVFDGYATHRNASLKGLAYKNEWVLILDADERVPNACASEMKEAIKNAGEVVAFRIQRRDFLWSAWLKHAQISPFYLRLVRPDRVHYEREINEVLVPEGPTADLKEAFDHYPFSKGMAHWISKHNTYSTMEAQRWLEEQQENVEFSWKKALFSKDFSEKRFHQKGLFYRFPGRPLIKFLYMTIARRAILDGAAGITYSLLQSIYEYFIILKQKELLLKRSQEKKA